VSLCFTSGIQLPNFALTSECRGDAKDSAHAIQGSLRSCIYWGSEAIGKKERKFRHVACHYLAILAARGPVTRDRFRSVGFGHETSSLEDSGHVCKLKVPPGIRMENGSFLHCSLNATCQTSKQSKTTSPSPSTNSAAPGDFRFLCSFEATTRR
jgi:hypothetical protein